jgi:riboflavin synthase
MFTGLIETTGEIIACQGETLTVRTPLLAGQLQISQSIAVDGVCLTVTQIDLAQGIFGAELSPETRRRTTLGELRAGHQVNLERPLLADGRLGGHFVLGHIDTVGRLVESRPQGRFVQCSFEVPPQFDALLVEKGSVAVDGISLTCFDVCQGRFAVAIIPKTWQETTLGAKVAGAPVNVEFDILGKYALKAAERSQQELVRRLSS